MLPTPSREDVGRHTALDKLIAMLALRRIDPATGFAVVASRCSFELARTAASAGFAGLAVICQPGDGVMTFAP